MKKIYFKVIMTVVAVALLAVGCQKENGTVALKARIATADGAKVYINDDLQPCWHNGEKVHVNGRHDCTTSASNGATTVISYDVSDGTPSSYTAIYPASIVDENADISGCSTVGVTLPREQVYRTDSHGDQKVMAPMCAVSNSTTLSFFNMCSLIKVVVNSELEDGFYLKRIDVSANSAYLSGDGTATIAGDGVGDKIVIDGNASNASHEVSLVFNPESRPRIKRGDRDFYTFYIAVPEFATENDVTITLYANGDRTYSVQKHNALSHNMIAEVSMTVDHLDGLYEGELCGLFSVGSGNKVRFSKGNLQYRNSTGVWRFAESQTDFVGGIDEWEEHYGTVPESSNNSISTSGYSGWIDLFGWGTGDDPTNLSAESSIFVEWGIHPIANGGNTANQWRTLTQGEWEFLLARNSGRRIGTGTVVDENHNEVLGLIVLPDANDWTLPDGCQFHSGTGIDFDGWKSRGAKSAAEAYERNRYTHAQWKLMEEAGALFLPAAGYREYEYDGEDYTATYEIEGQGYEFGGYWSSTFYNNSYGNTAFAVTFIEGPDGVNVGNAEFFWGYSVRLTRTVQQ